MFLFIVYNLQANGSEEVSKTIQRFSGIIFHNIC